GLQNRRPAVEVDDFGKILRSKLAGETDGRFLGDIETRFHAGARVEEKRERNGRVRPIEERQVLLDSVFEHLEVVLLEIGDLAARAVRDRDIERHELDAAAKRFLNGSWRRPLWAGCRSLCAAGSQADRRDRDRDK